MKDVFGIGKYNVIQDDEFYYVFRALNSGDNNDIIEGKTMVDGKFTKIRTDRQRWLDDHEVAEYDESEVASLQEVWDHIRQNHNMQTNCISFTSNSNVALDYGNGKAHNGRYIMLKIPKDSIDNERVFSAGEYMLKQIENKITEESYFIAPDTTESQLIREIDEANTTEQIGEIISRRYDEMSVGSPKGTFTSKEKTIEKESAISRLKPKKYFNEEQQLEYTKLIAKLMILESMGRLNRILPMCKDNTSLIATVSMALSSSEIVYYNEMPESEFVEVPEEHMNLFSLIQQIDVDEVNEDLIKNLQKKVLQNLNERIKLSQDYPDFNGENFSIEDAYKLTDGRLSYQKVKQAMEFYYRLCVSRAKAIENCNILEELNGKSDDAIEYIRSKGFVIDNDIITRKANIDSYILSEQVGLAIDRTENSRFSSSEQKKIIDYVLQQDEDELRRSIENFDIADLRVLLNNFLEKLNKVDLNRYYAEFIVDSIDLNKIYKEDKVLSLEERELLVSKLEKADCEKFFKAFKNLGVSYSEMSAYIMSLMASGGYKGFTFEDFSRLPDIESILRVNISNTYLKNRITFSAFDALLGRADNENLVEGTALDLRDYQQDITNRISDIYETKRFAGVILPTGAGKSYVAMDQMMKFKGKNILYIAPNKEILSQIKRHIIKNILKIEIVNDNEPITQEPGSATRKMHYRDAEKEIENILKIKFICYQGLDTKEKQTLENYDADFIIIDELHRAGAITWEPQIRELLNRNVKAKVLGLTATPERDVDGKNMMDVVAEMTGDFTRR